MSDAVNGSLDVSPRGNDGAEHHETEGEQCHWRHAAAEPQNLSIGNDDDCKVLEDRVYRYREELEGFGASIDHAHEE